MTIKPWNDRLKGSRYAIADREAVMLAEIDELRAALAGCEPFGYWYQVDDPDECEFFLAADISGDCKHCIPLYTHPSRTLTDAEIVAGAREICRRTAKECGTHPEDEWAFYGDYYREEFKAAIEAALKGQDK